MRASLSMFLFVPLALLLPLLECAAVLPVAKDAAALGPYRMREVLLDTEWTEKVAKDPWPEYPRPQLRRKHWKSLNGIWKHSSATGNQMHETSTVNGEMALLLGGAEVLVPFCLESALSGISAKHLQAKSSWYRRGFRLDEEWTDELKDIQSSWAPGKDWRDTHRMLLHFGAVDYAASVFVNGKLAKQHEGGYTSFLIDITDLLMNSTTAENTLHVYVHDPTDGEAGQNVAKGKQTLEKGNHIFYTPCSGIWQSVWLEPVPILHVSGIDLHVTADKRIEGMIVASGGRNDRVTLSVMQKGKILVSTDQVETNKPFNLGFQDAQLWSPESPTLYDIGITLQDDYVQAYTGFRTVSRGTVNFIPRPALNGVPMFVWGVLDQGYWPDGIYTPPTAAALYSDLKAMRDLGFNTIRKHVKVESALFYRYCDELGLMVIQDIPNMIGDGQPSTSQYEDFDKQALEIISQLKNYPSITIWTLYNEGWGQHDHGPEVALTKKVFDLDPTRLIDSASGWHDNGAGHFSSNHNYPMPYCGVVEDSHHENPGISVGWDRRRTALQSEFGGLGSWIDDKHIWSDPAAKSTISQTYKMYKDNPEWNAESFKVIQELINQITEHACSGAIWTQLSDVEGELNGMLSYDRRVLRADMNKWKMWSGAVYEAAENAFAGTGGVQLQTCKMGQCQNADHVLETTPDPGFWGKDMDPSVAKMRVGSYGNVTAGQVIGP